MKKNMMDLFYLNINYYQYIYNPLMKLMDDYNI